MSGDLLHANTTPHPVARLVLSRGQHMWPRARVVFLPAAVLFSPKTVPCWDNYPVGNLTVVSGFSLRLLDININNNTCGVGYIMVWARRSVAADDKKRRRPFPFRPPLVTPAEPFLPSVLRPYGTAYPVKPSYRGTRVFCVYIVYTDHVNVMAPPSLGQCTLCNMWLRTRVVIVGNLILRCAF